MKLPVVRDQAMQSLHGVSVESVSAFYDDDSGNLVVVGELVANDAVLEGEYREVQVVIHDAEGAVVGRGLSNWVSFGLRQSFEVSFAEGDGVYGTPASVKVFPASQFAVKTAVQDSGSIDPSGNSDAGRQLSSLLGRATVDGGRLAQIAENLCRFEPTPARAASLSTTASISFMSDDLDEVARLLGVQRSCLSQESGPIAVLEGDLRADADVNAQIAALLSRATDDLDAWRELAEEHSADLSVTITFSGGLCFVSLLEEVVLAIGERSLAICGQIACD